MAFDGSAEEMVFAIALCRCQTDTVAEDVAYVIAKLYDCCAAFIKTLCHCGAHPNPLCPYQKVMSGNRPFTYLPVYFFWSRPEFASSATAAAFQILPHLHWADWSFGNPLPPPLPSVDFASFGLLGRPRRGAFPIVPKGFSRPEGRSLIVLLLCMFFLTHTVSGCPLSLNAWGTPQAAWEGLLQSRRWVWSSLMCRHRVSPATRPPFCVVGVAPPSKK